MSSVRSRACCRSSATSRPSGPSLTSTAKPCTAAHAATGAHGRCSGGSSPATTRSSRQASSRPKGSAPGAARPLVPAGDLEQARVGGDRVDVRLAGGPEARDRPVVAHRLDGGRDPRRERRAADVADGHEQTVEAVGEVPVGRCGRDAELLREPGEADRARPARPRRLDARGDERRPEVAVVVARLRHGPPC